MGTPSGDVENIDTLKAKSARVALMQDRYQSPNAADLTEHAKNSAMLK
jgi:hypothetical protein